MPTFCRVIIADLIKVFLHRSIEVHACYNYDYDKSISAV